ncbi:MAG: hypothetical protein ABW203_06065, partial [Novosphingobium sp.]
MRALALAVVCGASLLLAACLLAPGTFTSELNLRRDGTFSYSYKGEIVLLGLSKLAQADAADGEFTPSTCYKDDGFEERKCTGEELTEQRKEWETSREDAKKKRESDAETAKAMLGGIDPSDPKAAEEFADRLRRQTGWRSVVNKGDGKFEVDFAIAGRLDHDFVFPTIERMPVLNQFVTVVRRADGSVRVDAPSFFPGGNSSPMMGMAGAMTPSSEGDDAKLPVLNGTFTIV